MKFIFQIICLLILLLIVFSVIDRKGGYSDNTISNQKNNVAINDSNDLNTQFSELKFMAETNSIVKTKPSTSETPIVATPSIDITHGQRKEISPTTETNPHNEINTVTPKTINYTETIRPIAVPVVTAEDAKIMNSFAIFLFEAKATIVEGEIIERSQLPDPKESDYPNCRFTAHVKGNSICSGQPCPKDLVLILEGFENYNILETNKLKAGDKIEYSIIPFDSLPEEFQSTQVADDLNLYLFENYYVINIKRIDTFRDESLMPLSGIFFSEENENYISLFERHINPPISQELKDAQDKSIQKELGKINKLLNGYDDAEIKRINLLFSDVWNKEKAKDPVGYNRVGNCVWRCIDNSFWALPIDYTLLKKTKDIPQDMIDCFVSLKKVLEANGVQLVISVVPDFYAISSRVINKDFRNTPDLQSVIYIKHFLQSGIEAFYYSDEIIQNFNRYPFAFFYPSNSHPADTTQDVITDILAKKIKERYGFDSEYDSNRFSIKQSIHALNSHKENSFPQNCDISINSPGTPFTCREVFLDEKRLVSSSASQILVVGNSFIQYPRSYPDSFPTLLSYKLLYPIHWFRIGWLGPFKDIIKELANRPEYFLKGKKVLIVQFGWDAFEIAAKDHIYVNIEQIDSERKLLNNKMLKKTITIPLNADVSDMKSKDVFNTWLDDIEAYNKTIQRLNQNGDYTYFVNISSFYKDCILAKNKPLTIVIQACCFGETKNDISINDQTKIKSFYAFEQANDRSKFYFLPFELPSGTEEITIRIKGKPDTVFAIQDIQIWQ